MTATPISANIIRFARHLRAKGLAVVPETAGTMMEAATLVGFDSRDDVYFALRAATVTRPEHLPVFDEAFAAFFAGVSPVAEAAPKNPDAEVSTISSLAGFDEGATDLDSVADQVGASAIERIAERDFGDMTPEELAEVRRLLARMNWHVADALTRRWAVRGSGPRPDLRRTLRGLVGPTGELMPLSWVDRKPRRRPLLVVADVSGSMERYVEMFLHFMHAARGRLGRVESFVFSTHLTRITRELLRRDPHDALADVGTVVSDWSGGTKIGDALHDFNVNWSRRVCRGGPIALIISDGWDCGDPAVLDREMDRFSRSVHRVIWLNHLAGREGFEPSTRGMRTAMPYVDHFLPAGNLRHLREVVRLIESVPDKR